MSQDRNDESGQEVTAPEPDEVDALFAEDVEPEEVAEPAEPAPRQARGGWGPAIATGFVAIAVALGVGWWLQQTLLGLRGDVLEAEAAAESAGAAAERSGKQVDREAESLRKELERLGAEAEAAGNAAAKFDSRFDALGETVSKLSDRQRADDRDWVMAQIEYLLFAANERLQLEGDVGAALAAMKAADERLKLLNDPSLIPIREQLVADMNALLAVPVTDLSGVALYLADLVRRVDELPLREIELGRAPEVGGDAEPGEASVLTRMWDDLVDLVDVETLEIPDAVITDPDSRVLLFETLRTELVTARLAVMRRDTDNLRASLEIVEKLLSDYFDNSAQAVVATLERLRELQGLELKPPIPEASGSLNAVRAARASA